MARELQDPFQLNVNDIYLQNLHKNFLLHLITMDRSLGQPPLPLAKRIEEDAKTYIKEKRWPSSELMKPLKSVEQMSRIPAHRVPNATESMLDDNTSGVSKDFLAHHPSTVDIVTPCRGAAVAA